MLPEGPAEVTKKQTVKRGATQRDTCRRRLLWVQKIGAGLPERLIQHFPSHRDSITRRIMNPREPLVKYLLFSGEATLTDPVQGTSGFAEDFVGRGPRDGRGRSLRDLDLRRRLFTYPCSYLIYSAAFDGLPGPVKDYVLQRLWDVLTGKDTSTDFAHLSAADRQAIRGLLLATKPRLPDYWHPRPATP
jgi:hypothetical protein